MMDAYIYSLCLPGSNHVWYVGETTIPLKERLGRHIRKAQRDSGGNKEKNVWIRKHIENVEIRQIEACHPSERKERETHWITHYKAMNEPEFLNKKGWDKCKLQQLRQLRQQQHLAQSAQ